MNREKYLDSIGILEVFRHTLDYDSLKRFSFCYKMSIIKILVVNRNKAGERMGIYLNPRNDMFKEAVNREIYVDKSLLIERLWTNVQRANKYICFSRPRRFGKSTDADMLVAFFSKGCDSNTLFQNLKVATCDVYSEMNQHNVIKINVQDFLSRTHDVDQMIACMYDYIAEDFEEIYAITTKSKDLSMLLEKAYDKFGKPFIFVVDEWDCIFREFKDNKEMQEKYIDYIRMLFKDKGYVKFVYMTGILPIKKYGTHSALNMFDEISVLDAKDYSEFVGFTQEEVEILCEKYTVDYETMKAWYDGYRMRGGISTYNPRSVTASLYNKDFSNYWSQTETYEALKVYIDVNNDGIKDDIREMLLGKTVKVDTKAFQNDMSTIASKNDVYTLLVHLGYLGYIMEQQEVYIPNNEVKDIFVTAIENSNWKYITQVLQNSMYLLDATWKMEEEKVAQYIENSHYETSILQYNDENALSYTVSLAYIFAKQYYNIVREIPTGKGFADIVFIPRKGIDKPAMLIELKYNQDVESGMNQIKDKKYYLGLEEYLDNLLLVAINYDKDTKEHDCVIELYNKK